VTQPLIKIGVVVSSVLLAGGAIAYRAGAFDRFLGSGTTQPAPTILPSSKEAPLVNPATPGSPDPQSSIVTPQELEMMSSSKSIILTRPTQPAAQPAPTILPGSKAAIAPVIGLPPTDPKVILPTTPNEPPAPTKCP
jgi:hypothetical protein